MTIAPIRQVECTLPPPAADIMLDTLRLEDFLPLVGQPIDVEFNGQRVQVELKEATPINNPSPRATPPFRLVLRSTSGWRAPQGIYRLFHPKLGAIDAFTVPIGPDGVGLCYDIVIN